MIVQYTDETASTLAKELLRDSDANTCIAVVAAPSVFVQLKNILVCSHDPDMALPFLTNI